MNLSVKKKLLQASPLSSESVQVRTGCTDSDRSGDSTVEYSTVVSSYSSTQKWKTQDCMVSTPILYMNSFVLRNE